MSDAVPTDPSPVIPPPSTPPTNELFPTSESPPTATLSQKIKSKLSGTFEKHGVLFKRGGGRPRKDGKPNKLDVPLNVPASNPPLAVTPGPETLDPALVKRCCSAVLKAASGFFDKILWNKAKRKTGSKDFANQIVADCSITTEETEAFSELAEVCLRKYGVGTQYAPEIGLGCIVAGIGVRYATAIKAIDGAPTPEPESNN